MTHLRGILLMLAAVATFSMMDVAMKHLVASYPAMQVTFLRGIASLPLLLAAVGLFGQWRDLVPKRWKLHLVRGLLSVVTLWGFIYAVKFLSLADAYAIFMSAPLLITALSGPVLREHVGPRRWIAVLAGMCGVAIVLKPSGSSLVTVGGLAALVSATTYALNALTIRVLSRTDSGASTVIYALSIMTLVAAVICLPRWVPLQPQHWPWIVALGVSGALGQYLFTEAFRRAPAAVIAPLEYSALAWGMLFDWVIWMTAPSLRMLVGAGIIIGGGLYIVHRERFAAAAPPGAVAPAE